MRIAWQVLWISGPNLVYGFLRHSVVHPQKDNILSYPLFILLSGPRKGGGLLQILISEAEEEEGVLSSKLEWI